MTKRSIKTAAPEDLFILATEYGVGHRIDEKSAECRLDYYAPGADIARVKKEKLCNGFRIWIDPDARKLRRASHGGYGMMIDFWTTEGRLELFARKKGLKLKAYLDRTADLMMKYMRQSGRQVWWNVWPEIDNPLNPYNWGFWPERFASRQEFYRFLREHFTTDKYCRNRDKRVLTPYDPYIGFKKPAVQYLQERGLDPKNVNLSAFTCRVSACHHYLDWGFTFVQQEINVGLANLQVAIAFLRGAARQYRGYWGLDPAPWKAPTPYPAIYDAEGRRLGGVSESLLQREWLVSFLAGTNYIGEQLSDDNHWLTDKKTGIKRFSPMGRMAQDVAEFTLRRQRARGRPYVPVALLLEKYHGWDCPTGTFGEVKQACMGEIPYEARDAMIEAFFAYAFPGYQERHRYCGDWWDQVVKFSKSEKAFFETGPAPAGASRPAAAPVLFHPNFAAQKPSPPGKNSKADLQWIMALRTAFRAGLDTRPYEQGELVPAPRGDSFDVFLEDAPLAVLRKYPALIMLGGIKLHPPLQAKLAEYVRLGGKLLANASQVGKENEEFLGVRLTGQKGQARRTRCRLCARKYDEGPALFEYEIIKPTAAEVLAVTDHQAGKHPLATRRRLGRGEIMLTTPCFGIKMEQQPQVQLLEIVKDICDHLIQPLLLVEIHGRPLEFLVNITPKGRIIMLVNNEPAPWSGIARLKDFKNGDNLRELWTEKNLFGYRVRNGAAELKLALAPFSFTIIGMGRY